MVSVLVTPTMALLAIIFAVIPKFPYIALLFFYSIGIVSFIGRSLLHYYYSEFSFLNSVGLCDRQREKLGSEVITSE